jgi:plastocyanin
MRRGIIWVLASATLLVGCGSASTFADKPRPATTVNLTVYVNNQRVSVSPASVGAGAVQFIITNQAAHNESVEVQDQAGSSIANTGPINPGATATVTVDFHPGDYTLSTGATSTAHQIPGIVPATLHIGRARPNADNELLQP